MNVASEVPAQVPPRLVALGASNLTRGFHVVVSAARRAWGPDAEVLAALGRGRSYGAPSWFFGRTLPGIVESGLWCELARRPEAPARALVTDVGNDILYGRPVEQTLAWVEECIERLQRHTRDIVLTDLPVANIERLSRARFLLFRSLFFPRCRLSMSQVVERSERVSRGLGELAVRRGLRFVRLAPEWYGFDPIHIRASRWRAAWSEILGGDTGDRGPDGWALSEALRLYLMPPERRWLLGMKQVTPQSGLRLSRGGRVWLY